MRTIIGIVVGLGLLVSTSITESKTGKALTAVASNGGAVRIVVAPLGQGDEQKWELIKTDPAKLTM